MFYLVWLAIGVAFGWFTANAAKDRGRDPALWGILGFFFGFVPLLVLLITVPAGGATMFREAPQCPKCGSSMVDEDPTELHCRKCDNVWVPGQAA